MSRSKTNPYACRKFREVATRTMPFMYRYWWYSNRRGGWRYLEGAGAPGGYGADLDRIIARAVAGFTGNPGEVLKAKVVRDDGVLMWCASRDPDCRSVEMYEASQQAS